MPASLPSTGSVPAGLPPAVLVFPASPLRRRQQPTRPPARFSSFLLDLADPWPGSRVVLLGRGELELGCELIRAGEVDVTFSRLGGGDGPHDRRADIAIAARAETADDIEAAVRVSRRVLDSFGTLILGRVPHALLEVAAAALRRHGLTRLRIWAEPDGLVLQAELPMLERVGCA